MAKQSKKTPGVVIPPPRPGITIDLGTIELLNPDGIRPVYSNNAAVMMNAHDLRLLFSELVMDSISASPKLELRANVAMSPTQFKALAMAVKQTLEGFKKQFGEIAWPPKNQ